MFSRSTDIRPTVERDSKIIAESRDQGWKMTRPSFTAAWVASQRIYAPVNSRVKVAKIIGGYVEKNINNPDPRQRWTNTCAVRMSYILSHSGLTIPSIPGQTVSGADRRQYFSVSGTSLPFFGRNGAAGGC
jgi:hypothetical protein